MWNRVRLAVAEHQPGANAALNRLCQPYETPILTYMLRHRHSPLEAHDLAQSLFLQRLVHDSSAKAHAAKI